MTSYSRLVLILCKVQGFVGIKSLAHGSPEGAILVDKALQHVKRKLDTFCITPCLGVTSFWANQMTLWHFVSSVPPVDKQAYAVSIVDTCVSVVACSEDRSCLP